MNRKEKIGKKGDFITAPEISQVFGELIGKMCVDPFKMPMSISLCHSYIFFYLILGVWCIYMWNLMGKPSTLQLVELGPGNGSLIAQVLSATTQFEEFSKALRSIVLIEGSSYLQEKQREAIDKTLRENCSSSVPKPVISWHTTLPLSSSSSSSSSSNDVTHDQEHIKETLDPVPTLFIAQEFFDAMPIHQFLYAAHLQRIETPKDEETHQEETTTESSSASCLHQAIPPSAESSSSSSSSSDSSSSTPSSSSSSPSSSSPSSPSPSRTPITYNYQWSELLVDVDDHPQSTLQFSTFPSLEITPALHQAEARGILHLSSDHVNEHIDEHNKESLSKGEEYEYKVGDQAEMMCQEGYDILSQIVQQLDTHGF